MDLRVTPDRDGTWTNKRLPDHVLPVEEATFVAEDGIRYLSPEITLLYKAGSAARRTTGTSRSRWPLLAPEQRDWLRDGVRGCIRSTPGSTG